MNMPLVEQNISAQSFRLGFGLAVLTLSACLTLPIAAGAELKVGDALPDLTAQSLEGELPGNLNGKILVVDFWASWCLPCKQSFPVLEELHQKYKDRGVVLIGVCLDQKKRDMEKFLKKQPVTFTIVRDAEEKLAVATDMEVVPTTFIVGSDGKLCHIHSGFHGDETRQQYIAEIEALLKAKP